MHYFYLFCAKLLIIAPISAGLPIQHEPGVLDYRELDAAKTSRALSNRIPHPIRSEPDQLYDIELNDGSQFPVVFVEEDIHLNNGWYSFSIRSSSLLDVSVDGGICGTLLDQSGNQSPIDYVFVEDTHLRVRMPNSSSCIKIPWNQVRSIRKQPASVNEVGKSDVDKKDQSVGLPKIQTVEPPVRFRSDQYREELKGLAWIDEPPTRFHPDSSHVEFQELAWVEDVPQFQIDETKQLALAQESANFTQLRKVIERGVKESVQELHGENRRLKSEIGELKAYIVQLKGQIQAAEDPFRARAEVARQSRSNRESENIKILNLLDSYSVHMKLREDEIRKLNHLVLKLEDDLKNLSKENRLLKDSQYVLANEKNVLQKEIGLLSEQVSKGKGQIEKLNDCLASKNLQQEELLTAFESVKSERELLLADHLALENTVNRLQEKFSKHENRQKMLTTEIENKNNEMHALENEHANQLEFLALELQSLYHQLSVQEQQGMALKGRTAQLANQLSESHQSLEAMKIELEEKNNLLSALRNERDEVEIKFEEAVRDKENLALCQSQMEVVNNLLVVSCSELEAQLKALNVEIEGVNAKARQLKTLQSEKQLQIEQLRKSYQEALVREEAALNALTKERQEGEKASEQVKLLSEQLSREKKLSYDYKQKMDQLFPHYDREKEKGLQLQQQISRLQQRIKDFEEALKTAETRQLASQKYYSQITANNQRLHEDNQRLANQLRQVQLRLQEQRDLAARLNESINAVNRDVDGGRVKHSNQDPEFALSKPVNDYSNSVPEHMNLSSAKNLAFISFKEIHVVAEGENLNNISMKYYNTPDRWEDIYEANLDVIADVNQLKLGTPLVIPE